MVNHDLDDIFPDQHLLEGGHAHVHAENISREPIGYSRKSALTGLSGVH